MATVDQIRNSAVVTKRTVEIDSLFKTSGTNSNFIFDMGVTIDNVQLIDIKGIHFVNVINNIDINHNKLNWVDGLGVTHFSVLPIGNYDDSTLCSAIENLLDTDTTESEFYTCQSDRINTKFIIANGVGNTFDLLFGVSQNESIGKIIGFGVTNYFGIVSQTGLEILNISPTKGLYIGSTSLRENATDVYQVSNGATNIINRYDVAGFFGDTIRDRSLISMKQSNNSLRELDFRLIDDEGVEVIMPTDNNNDYFSITLDIYSGIFDLTYYD
jgi:hypothetical protein